MAIMTPDEEDTWNKVKFAVYVLGGYVRCHRGETRFTCAVTNLPMDDLGMAIRDMAERWESTHAVVEVMDDRVHVSFDFREA